LAIHDTNEAHTLKAAGIFDVHKWSDYPQVKEICDFLFKKVIAFRKEQNPKARSVSPDKVKRHLRVLLIDLYVASQGLNPWRGISKRKADYRKRESRYRRIFLTYDFLIPLIDDLTEFGYIIQEKGFKDWTTGKGFRTRISASKQLLDLIEAPPFGIKEAIKAKGLAGLVIDNPEVQRELIILRDKNGNLVEYEDDDNTNAMRHNLEQINAKLQKARITLRASDEQFEEIQQRLMGSKDEDREPVDFFNKTLHRVFNGDFQHGGRFYGGWWIGVPKEFRELIEINYKHTTEVDFSGHHIRMLYAKDGHLPPDDPYHIKDSPFPREVLKQAFLILINAENRASAVKACARKGIKAPLKVFQVLEAAHQPIAQYFYSGKGLGLQYEDSILAEQIMLRMMTRGATVLTVHDSFIVRASYQDELEYVMDQVFSERYNVKPVMKTKPTVRDQQQVDEEDFEEKELQPITTNLEELLKGMDKYSKYIKLWGLG